MLCVREAFATLYLYPQYTMKGLLKLLSLAMLAQLRLTAGEKFPHFEAHSETMTCTADEHARPFNNQIRGANLGGWMVLEPWITPSLFYQVSFF